MNVRAVLFDIDGTLVDSNDLHVSVWRRVFASHGVQLSAQAIHGQIGKGADLLVPALMPGADEKTAQRLGDEHGRLFKADHLAAVAPLPGARDLLVRTHAAAIRVAIASSASQEELDHHLDLLDVRSMVDASITIDDVATSKPAPDVFAAALKKVGVPPEDALAVGDSPYDVQSAGKSGIATIALRSGGFSDHALQTAGAIAIYDDAAALLADFDRSPLGSAAAA